MLSMVLAASGTYTSVHIGDNRCYSVYANAVSKTVNDSPIENMFRNGLITGTE